MTKEEEKILHQFETRVRQLMMKYQSVVAENEQLKTQLAQQEAQVAELNELLNLSQQDYATLKMAKMLEVNAKDQEAALKRVAKLIREVDKCIALLNV
ncbi:MAG: hypothetical protein HUK09_04445 [Bacteroidaceae bacterium]|mgnify:FL=1|nr:hypothetical protein [Bacteroidaceae bacterium]